MGRSYLTVRALVLIVTCLVCLEYFSLLQVYYLLPSPSHGRCSCAPLLLGCPSLIAPLIHYLLLHLPHQSAENADRHTTPVFRISEGKGEAGRQLYRRHVLQVRLFLTYHQMQELFINKHIRGYVINKV